MATEATSENQQPPRSTAVRLELGAPVPDFEAISTQGLIKFSDWQKGRWVVLFSHPADFTPVCTTEFVEFAKRFDDFEKKNVALIGNSIDSVYSHIAWIRNIEQNFKVQVRFPVIADLDQKVARTYGMVHEATAVTAAVRCVFFIDPKRHLRALIYYPLNVGRNFDEISRVVDALQMADTNGVACPADWRPGDPVIVPAPVTAMAAEERTRDKTLQVTEWYFSKKKL